MKRLTGSSGAVLALLALAAGGARDGAAQAGCPWNNRDFLGPCGPSQALPPWGNGAWSAPEYYTTIQTGDLDGDGAAELLGRSAFGIEIHKFAKERGEWLPFLATMPDGTNRPVPEQYLLTRFADAGGWDQPRYYATIQTGDIDGDGGAELLARASIGLIVFKFVRGAAGAPGVWRQLTGLTVGAACTDNVGDVCATPFSDASGLDQPQYYSTIRLADVDGKPGADLHVRAPDGIWSYRWTGSAWELIARIRDNFRDDGSWDQPQHYSTIQFAQLDNRPGAELLARGAGGITVWRFDGTNWGQIAAGGPFRGDGFAHPQYYTTIQTADVTGDGVAELLGRTANGIEAYRWQIDQWIPLAPIDDEFRDDLGWDLPQYYSTIQFADLDGKPGAELVARANGAVFVLKWAAAGWSRIKSAEGLAFAAGYAATASGRAITVPLWDLPHYYATIQATDLDGDGAAELLARGSFGIRTWRLDITTPNNPHWTRYLPYGYPDPAFPTIGQQTAYKALNLVLGVADVRQAYRGTTISPNPQEYQTQIERTCTAPPSSTSPPQYRSCAPPAGSGVEVPDWTAVANQIIAELFHAQKVTAYYGELASAQVGVFAESRDALEAVAGQLKLQGQAATAAGAVNFLTLLGNITGVLGTLATLAGQDELSSALSTFSSIMGGFAAAPPTSSGLVFEQTYTGAIGQLLANEQQQRDAVPAQQSFVRGDLQLLTAVGELVSKPRPTLPLWQIDQPAYTSAARQAFATWVYQTFLPVVWDRWVITNCTGSTIGPVRCALPPNGRYMAAYDQAAGTFTGLLPQQSPCRQTSCLRGICIWTCAWSAPSDDIVDILWGGITSNCTYDRDAGTAWEYGACNLGIASGPASDIFNGRNGWDFTTRSGHPVVSLAAVSGRIPVAVKGGHLRLAARVPLGQDLGTATVAVDRLLHEDGGAGELGHNLAGEPGAPPLQALRTSPRHAIFRTFPGDEPRLLVKLRVRRGELEAELHARRIIARDPALCAGLAPSTDLWTVLTIDDGFNAPLPLPTAQAWECREKRNDGRELLAPPERRNQRKRGRLLQASREPRRGCRRRPPT